MNNKQSFLEDKNTSEFSKNSHQIQKHMITMNSSFKPKQFRHPEHIIQNPLKNSLSNLNSYKTPSFNREKFALNSVKNQLLPCISDDEENSREKKDESISGISLKNCSTINKTVHNLIQIVESKTGENQILRDKQREKTTSSELLLINQSQSSKLQKFNSRKDNYNSNDQGDEKFKITLSIDKVNRKNQNGYLYTIYNNDLIEGNIFVKERLVKNMVNAINEGRKNSPSQRKRNELGSKRELSIATNDSWNYTPKLKRKEKSKNNKGFLAATDSETLKCGMNERTMHCENSSCCVRRNSNTTTQINSSLGKINGYFKVRSGRWPLEQLIAINEINLVYLPSNYLPLSSAKVADNSERAIKSQIILEKKISLSKDQNIPNRKEEITVLDNHQLITANKKYTKSEKEKPFYSKKIYINNSKNLSCGCTIF